MLRYLLAAVTAGLYCRPGAADTYIAGEVRDFQTAGPSAMMMPTAVAVDARNHVFVADGVNDRIVHFGPQGELLGEIREVGGQKLSNPIGLRADAGGDLWIADTGNHRVLVRRPDGTLVKVIVPNIDTAGPPLDLTDVLPLPGTGVVWLVDNDNNRLLRLAGADPLAKAFGGQGDSLGRFQYPFAIALDNNGDLFVTDVINARVQILNPRGQSVGLMGSYGVEIGQFYRPKGIACDARGLIWVADGTLGVVQIFTAMGRSVDVLRDAKGSPFRFDMPMGLAFDGQDRLYVVELKPGRVKRLDIIEQKQVQAPPRPPRARARPPQPKECTVCHLEWIEPFISGRGSSLTDRPESTVTEPLVSRADICLSCHDGSVLDSRRRVWREHGHATGVQPSASMKVPSQLPLVEGKLACRTCHSAHSSGRPEEGGLSGALFLRSAGLGQGLCAGCHPEKAGGPASGSHPIGGMPWPIPQTLIDAGAHPGPDRRELTCQVCHVAHGARRERLLVMGTESSQLCLTCHARLRPGMWMPTTPREHPQNPPLSTDAQRNAIREMGTTVGAGDTLICLSCHKLHHGLAGRYMLADTLNESRLCVRCHPQRESMFNTPHDLRKSAPAERNRLGQTPQESGPCGACHSFHQFARRPDPQPADPSGLCSTCHMPERCAGKRTGRPFGHPLNVPAGYETTITRARLMPDTQPAAGAKLICTTCHDPHDTVHPQFLIDRSDQICADCHRNMASSLVGAHDFTGRADLKNAHDRTAQQSGKCGFCHAVHGVTGPMLWSATSAHPKAPDDMCLLCHREGGLSDKPAPALLHPHGPATLGKLIPPEKTYPRYDEQCRRSDAGFVACGSCHDPHGNSQSGALLVRDAQGAPTHSMCSLCHQDVRFIAATPHSQSHIGAFTSRANLHGSPSFCEPCHAVHEGLANDSLNHLLAIGERTGYPPDTHQCLGCHGPGGQATTVRVTVHPVLPMRNIVDVAQPGFLPLVDQRGQMGTEGRITCLTCHVPHGREPSGGLPALDLATAGQPEIRGLQALLQPCGVPGLCSSCHGAQGLANYLYYHYPEKRQIFSPMQPSGQ